MLGNTVIILEVLVNNVEQNIHSNIEGNEKSLKNTSLFKIKKSKHLENLVRKY